MISGIRLALIHIQEVIMKNANLYLKVLLLITSAALISSCGTSKDANSDYDFSSRIGNSSDPLGTIDPKNRPLAYCNKSTNSLIEVVTAIYKSGDTILNDFINLKITKVPAYFNQSQNYIQFWKWQANPQGQTDMGSAPLRFQIVEASTGTPLTNAKTSLYWNDLQGAAQAVAAATPADLFSKVRLVVDLQDPYAEYDAIRTVYYNMDNSPVSELDSLIPIFDADPVKYAKEPSGANRATILQDLHPFKSFVGLGWTSTYYQTKANEFCTPMNLTP